MLNDQVHQFLHFFGAATHVHGSLDDPDLLEHRRQAGRSRRDDGNSGRSRDRNRDQNVLGVRLLARESGGRCGHGSCLRRAQATADLAPDDADGDGAAGQARPGPDPLGNDGVAADDARVGIGTARSNLENVFRKTGRTSAEPTGRTAQECAAVERTGSGIAIHRRELHLAIIETLGFNLDLVHSQPASMV